MSHAKSGKSASFGELAMAASKVKLPDVETLSLKSPKEYTHIGASHAIVDMQDMLTGKALYGYDVQVDGMLCASITRPPARVWQ
ncbi:isoquinoline 1-oxidoreductase, beta subunit, putative [Shewanella benthica KT99]|uniref:Isoquinoline 1-oxidoreductase, beta subunit, putative n=1 Tax=Shewanella benthica KT99 TaxID=314608 RepID=A9D7K6_9GAMM|nr:isoquinoline 1-oxidoreductase, beta subunit, putative [Shewanella benthica KT99]